MHFYFPIQKFLKIISRTSSLLIEPVILPSSLAALLISCKDIAMS